MRYLRLWRRFAIIALVREAEYRVNFLISAAQGVAELALAVLSLLLLYRFTDQVAGWSRAQVLLLTGVYRLVDGLIALQIAPNMTAVSGYIRRGELDFLLLRPVSNQFLVSLRTLAPAEALNVLTGAGLALYAGNLAGVHWSLLGLATAALFICCGVTLLYALWFAIVTCSIWLVQVDTLDSLFYSLFETARYPVAFFKGGLRAALTFVVPVAFATTLPTQALLGTGDPRLLAVGLAMAVAALGATHLFWTFALRHYSSASS